MGSTTERWREKGRQEERAKHREEIRALALTLAEVSRETREAATQDERARLRPLLERCHAEMSKRPPLGPEGSRLFFDLRRELGLDKEE